jgi:hypothetical protein
VGPPWEGRRAALDSDLMPSGFVTRTAGKVTDRVPGLRRVPIVQVLTAAELALITHDHLRRLTPDERRRLVTLVRLGHGRRSRLTASERIELEDIVAKLAPRQILGDAVSKLSPVPLPRRITHGRRH